MHDHSVVRAVQRNIKKLPCSHSDNLDQQILSIKGSILDNGSITDAVASDALKVADSLTELHHSTFGISEKEALVAVWDKVKGIEDPTVRKNVTETLAKQLASGVEHGEVVCSTGKIARIVSTLDGVAGLGNEEAKPMWALKEEIGNLAAKVRQSHLDRMSARDQVAYEQGDLAPDAMQADFRQSAHALYVDQLKMSRDIIAPLVESYAQAF